MGSAVRDVLTPMMRRYPVMPFRGKLPLLRTEQIPDGAIVQTHEGVRVRVHPDGMYTEVYYWGDYEPFNTKVYRNVVRRSDVVLDVGANFGWFSMVFARWVGREGQVHAFEPVPFIFEFGEETIRLNPFAADIVRMNNVALGKEPGTLVIHTYPDLPHGHATAATLDRGGARSHVCRLETLDAYREQNGLDQVHFMKVDVEGFEPDVFLGAEGLLGRDDAPVVAFELNPECLAARSVDPGDVLDILRGLGYVHFYRLSTRHGVQRATGTAVEEGDYLAAKPSRLDAIAAAIRTTRLLR